MTTNHPLLRPAGLLLLVLALTASASAGITNKRLLARIVQHTPAAVIVGHGDEMRAAEVAAARTGSIALWGVGSSMEPIYAPNTAVVVTEMAYDDIRKGMTVVYRKANGRLVAHTVVGEDARGYIVQGVNNDEPDRISVDERNLLGVITAAFSASPADFHRQVAKVLEAGGRAVAMR